MNPKGDHGSTALFDRQSRTYERRGSQIFKDRVHEIALQRVGEVLGERSPGSILDVGCGTGRLLRRAGRRWPQAELIGVDPSPGMLETARRLAPGPIYYSGSAESLPLPSASVDLALSTFSVHHWSDGAAGTREIARVLRPGGRFCLADAAMPAGLSMLIHHFERNRPDLWRILFSQGGLEIEMQDRRLAGFILVMLGLKR